MPPRCVIYDCSNTILSPIWGDNTPVAIKRGRVWITFVNTERAKWTPSRSSVICSNHSSKDCFEYGSETVGTYKVPKLKRDEYGFCVFSKEGEE